MSSPAGEMTIDEILARVRSETADDRIGKSPEPGRRQGLGTIPLVNELDDGEIIPTDKPLYTIEEFAALDDKDFLRNAYRVVLGREIDGVGRSYYLPALQQGHIGVVRVLSALSRSTEGRARGVRIRWLMPAALLDRLTDLPVFGKLFEPLMRLIVRSTVNRRLSTHAQRHEDLIHEINAALSAIRKNLAAIQMRVTKAEEDFGSAMEASVGALSEIRAIRQEVSGGRAALGQLIEMAKAEMPKGTEEVLKTVEDTTFDSLYVAFENRFRGSTTEIARRTERYLPILLATPPVASGNVVLDIGCGRGEFLSFLAQKNIVGRGIDLNSAMVAEARGRGLDILEGDALDYLRALPDNSLAAITGFHIVEHIGFKDLIGLFDAAQRVLMPGGIVLFETPNPENIVVGACTFNYDPTHNKPLPPDYLSFVAEARGFSKTRIIRTDGDCDLSNPEVGFKPEEVNDWFRQPPDYALYAQKSVQDIEH